MTHEQHQSTRPKTEPAATRARWLVIALALAAVACALVAVLAGSDARAVFGGTALVLAVAAIWGGIEVATVKQCDPEFDLEGPPPVTALPQSPVTQTYEPEVPPYKSLERTREE
jgi:hypothetical protein